MTLKHCLTWDHSETLVKQQLCLRREVCEGRDTGSNGRSELNPHKHALTAETKRPFSPHGHWPLALAKTCFFLSLEVPFGFGMAAAGRCVEACEKNLTILTCSCLSKKISNWSMELPKMVVANCHATCVCCLGCFDAFRSRDENCQFHMFRRLTLWKSAPERAFCTWREGRWTSLPWPRMTWSNQRPSRLESCARARLGRGVNFCFGCMKAEIHDPRWNHRAAHLMEKTTTFGNSGGVARIRKAAKEGWKGRKAAMSRDSMEAEFTKKATWNHCACHDHMH